jgi:hypothetical protein
MLTVPPPSPLGNHLRPATGVRFVAFLVAGWVRCYLPCLGLWIFWIVVALLATVVVLGAIQSRRGSGPAWIPGRERRNLPDESTTRSRGDDPGVGGPGTTGGFG